MNKITKIIGFAASGFAASLAASSAATMGTNLPGARYEELPDSDLTGVVSTQPITIFGSLLTNIQKQPVSLEKNKTVRLDFLM